MLGIITFHNYTARNLLTSLYPEETELPKTGLPFIACIPSLIHKQFSYVETYKCTHTYTVHIPPSTAKEREGREAGELK